MRHATDAHVHVRTHNTDTYTHILPHSLPTALLLAFFNFMLWRAFLQGKEIDCGCFGPGEALTWKTLLRDGSMLAGALLVAWWTLWGRRFRLPRPS